MTDQRPKTGEMQTLEPGIRRILAPNPSPMTYWGTNTYVIGEGEVAILDPGPADPAHLAAIIGGLQPGEKVGAILVTHAHLDHSPLAQPLAEQTGAPVIAYGDALAGRSAVMRNLVASGMTSGGEGVDADFRPDICVTDGECFDAGGHRIEAVWTPGHFANHLCFALGDALFTGDHVMGWASSLVSPPDGDLTAFMTSCEKLRARQDRVYYPGHGAPVEAPGDQINWLISHRKMREKDILMTLEHGEANTVRDLTTRIYSETPRALLPAAERNVFAHLIDLVSRDLVRADPALAPDAIFFLKRQKN